MENIDFEKIFSFIADILNAKPEENTYIKKFDSLVKNDFSVFCDSVRDLNQMKDVHDFDEIKNQMRLIANCPPLHSKMVGAVGGGFVGIGGAAWKLTLCSRSRRPASLWRC